MAQTAQKEQIQEMLVDYVQDARALEDNVENMLTSTISTTPDGELKQMYEQHLKETKRHQELMQRCLEELGSGKSMRKETAAVGGSLMKGMIDQVRGHKAGKNGRDAYVTEHLEIASYELLKRLAGECGDRTTGEACDQILADERAMAKKTRDAGRSCSSSRLRRN